MATNIKSRRLLSELFKTGVEIRFGADENGNTVGKVGPFVDDDGRPIPRKEGREVAMFVRPPDPLQREMAMRSAQAKRAASLVRAKRDEDSEEHLTILAFLADMSDETLVEYVLAAEQMERHSEAEREVLGLDEWKDFTALQDAFREYEDKEPEELEGDAEFQALMELDEKFGVQVTEREKQLTNAQREALGFLQREQVERKALEKRAELVGSQAFMHEYDRQMLYYSVRDPDKIDELFFENATELASQPDEVRDLISDALAPFISEAGEAKNSPRAASSSDSSALPANPETSATSSPEEPTA